MATASFGTVAKRLGEMGIGYLTGAAEREAAARTERLTLLSQGLQLGASGVDLTQYLTPDMVSEDNRPFLTGQFAGMGNKLTEPYRQRVQLAAAMKANEQAFDLQKQEREFQYRDLWNRRTTEATLTAAAIRKGSDDDLTKIIDQRRVDELTDEEIGSLMITHFPFLLSGEVDKKGNATVNPEYAPIMAQITSKIKAGLTPEDYQSYPSMRAAIQREWQKQAPAVKEGSSGFLGLGAEKPSVQFNQVSKNEVISKLFEISTQAIAAKTNPNERALVRQKVLQEVEKRYGKETRDQFDQKLPR